jgi:hypothetical protein
MKSLNDFAGSNPDHDIAIRRQFMHSKKSMGADAPID